MLRYQTKRVAQGCTSERDFAGPLDPVPTQEEILHEVGLLLAIALGFAAMASAAFEVGIIE
jgi:hypothetical protein